MDLRWAIPGITLVALSLAISLLNIVLTVAKRPQPRLWLRGLQIRQIGIGLTLVGGGIAFVVPALLNGLDAARLGVGILIAGMGGLYFISASDSVFRTGKIATPPHWEHRPPSRPSDEHPPNEAP